MRWRKYVVFLNTYRKKVFGPAIAFDDPYELSVKVSHSHAIQEECKSRVGRNVPEESVYGSITGRAFNLGSCRSLISDGVVNETRKFGRL